MIGQLVIVFHALDFQTPEIEMSRPATSKYQISRKLWFMLLTLAALATSLLPKAASAQFVQQGTKLVGTGAVGLANEGSFVALSADGNTAVSSGDGDNSGAGAAWIFTRSGATWSQQGAKLVGTNAVGNAQQGHSAALSADGNTLVVGGDADNSNKGAVWVYTRSGGTWTQQGTKLVGTNAFGTAYQGYSVSISNDGNTIISGGYNDNGGLGAAWVFTRSGGVWSQQGNKLVGTGAMSNSSYQGWAVALSGDGNTAIIGGPTDTSLQGAAWVFTRNGNVWTQQGAKLVGNGAIGNANQGVAVSLSSDGNTALIGGSSDNSTVGATWIFTRSNGVWAQQGTKLVGSGSVGFAQQGAAVSLSGDGNNAVVGGNQDNSGLGAAWVFVRSAGVWNQQGTKLVGTGTTRSTNIEQGYSVAFSGDAGTILIGGYGDNSGVGAAWAFTQPVLSLTPASAIATSGNVGGPFSPPSFDYVLQAINNDTNYSVSGTPTWLTASSTSGIVSAGASKTLTFTVNGAANAMPVGTYGPTAITITNVNGGVGSATISATLTVGTAGPVTVVSAVLPSSRSVQVGNAATAFSTIINTSSNVATNCSLGLGSSNPASFRYQTTDSASNALSGTPNTPINIPPNGVQSFVFAITPSGAFDPTDVPITAGCSNGTAAPNVVGLNTLLLSASNAPVPDIVALGATASNDGIVNIPGASGTGAFAVATVNVGIGGNITASADTGASSIPVSINLCQTNPATGQCTSVVGPSVSTSILANGTPTFAIFVQGTANVPFDPAKSRIFVRFKDAGGIVRGATSVAVRTQ